MTSIDITFRNVDEEVLREFKAEAVRENKTFGEALADALRMWLEHKWPIKKKKMTLLESRRLGFHSGIRDLSKRVDELVYKR
ncbi:hypothetical protein J4450_07245 [Candidatus Micrarchaeota archaeon]|nr:hypothetical protein [Candidatus Micrarchaeota archaeon]